MPYTHDQVDSTRGYAVPLVSSKRRPSKAAGGDIRAGSGAVAVARLLYISQRLSSLLTLELKATRMIWRGRIIFGGALRCNYVQ